MAPITLFRDMHAPRADAERLAYERYLLDTHAERRAPATPKLRVARALQSLFRF